MIELTEDNIPISTMKDIIEEKVFNGNSYIDAMLEFCTENSIDPESMPINQIPKPILEKIEAEAYHRRLLKGSVTFLEGL